MDSKFYSILSLLAYCNPKYVGWVKPNNINPKGTHALIILVKIDCFCFIFYTHIQTYLI